MHTVVIEAQDNMITQEIGQNSILLCEMYGYLRGEIEWLKNGQQVQSGGRYSITVRTGSREGQDGGEDSVSSVVSQLTIQRVEEGDEGIYTCRASGTDSINITGSLNYHINHHLGMHSVSLCAFYVIYMPILLQLHVSDYITQSQYMISLHGDLLSVVESVPTTQSSSATIYIAVGVVIGTAIVLLSIAVIIAFIVLVVFKRKRTTVSLGDNNNHSPLRKMTMSPDVKNIEATEIGIPQYSEITPLPVPRAVKVTTLPQQVQLQHNPMYDSSECLIDMPLAKSKSVDTFDSALLSEFNIYATPNRQQPPPVPPYRGTPDAELRPVYNEKIDPSMFQTSSSLGSSVEVHPYSSIYADPEQVERLDIVVISL